MIKEQLAKDTINTMLQKDGLDVSHMTCLRIERRIKELLHHRERESFIISGIQAVRIMIDEDGLDASTTTVKNLEQRMNKLFNEKYPKESNNDSSSVSQELVYDMIEKYGTTINNSTCCKLKEHIQKVIEEEKQKTKYQCINALKKCEDMNDMTETDIIWIDLEEAEAACLKA